MTFARTDLFHFDFDGLAGRADGCGAQGVTETQQHIESDTNPMRPLLPFRNMPRCGDSDLLPRRGLQLRKVLVPRCPAVSLVGARNRGQAG